VSEGKEYPLRIFGFILIKSLKGFSRFPVISWFCNLGTISNREEDQGNKNTRDISSSNVDGVTACSSTLSLHLLVKSNRSSSLLPQGNL
jgi:hypothetical protein